MNSKVFGKKDAHKTLTSLGDYYTPINRASPLSFFDSPDKKRWKDNYHSIVFILPL